MLPHILILVPALLTLAALGFFAANLLALWHWRRETQPQPSAGPVSILKPLRGADPEMYEAFRSHCEQDYPAAYEIIFGVSSLEDPAVAYMERLKAEYPNVPIKLFVGRESLGTNGKVSNLAQMLKLVQYRHIVINDSDIRVPRDYLRGVMAWFGDPNVGMVTCLYRARAGKTLWSKLEAIGVLADFMPGALTARMLERKVRFGLGSTMAIDREALDAIGGLLPFVNHLADDYELGSRICDSGKRVIVPGVVVETATPDYNFRDFWLHQLRWGRTVRSSRPGGYAGIVATFGLLWAVVTVLASDGAPWSLALLATTLAVRIAIVSAYGRALKDSTAKYVGLLPLRDMISPIVWLLSLGGSRIVWRGEEFKLSRGKLMRVG
jgi:ceramide glucosyltransferase